MDPHCWACTGYWFAWSLILTEESSRIIGEAGSLLALPLTRLRHGSSARGGSLTHRILKTERKNKNWWYCFSEKPVLVYCRHPVSHVVSHLGSVVVNYAETNSVGSSSLRNILPIQIQIRILQYLLLIYLLLILKKCLNWFENLKQIGTGIRTSSETFKNYNTKLWMTFSN